MGVGSGELPRKSKLKTMPASYIDDDHIQIGTLPVPVKSALKSKIHLD